MGSRRRKNSLGLEEFADWYRGLVWAAHLEHRHVQLANAHDALHVSGVEKPDVVAAIAETHCLQSVVVTATDSKGYDALDGHPVETHTPDGPRTKDDEKPKRRWQRPVAAQTPAETEAAVRPSQV